MANEDCATNASLKSLLNLRFGLVLVLEVLVLMVLVLVVLVLMMIIPAVGAASPRWPHGTLRMTPLIVRVE